MTVITTVTALMSHIMPIREWADACFEVKVGDEIDLALMRRRLVELGYERGGQAEAPGQFAVRGNILDIYPMDESSPVRIELWGDEVDSIRAFDAESQRSIENLESALIVPACEMVMSEEKAGKGLERIRREDRSQSQKGVSAFVSCAALFLRSIPRISSVTAPAAALSSASKSKLSPSAGT